MITAQISVNFEDGWTSDLTAYDVYAEWPVSTFYDETYLGVINLYTDDFEEVFATISEHESVDTVSVVETTTENETTVATLVEREINHTKTPLIALHEEGYLPLRPTRMEGGRQYYDLLFEDHEQISDVVSLLSSFGNVRTDSISQDFTPETIPSTAEWQELLDSITPAQRRLLEQAVENGYFEIPREETLEELGDEVGITKATASHQMRKVQKHLAEFAVQYIQPRG